MYFIFRFAKLGMQIPGPHGEETNHYVAFPNLDENPFFMGAKQFRGLAHSNFFLFLGLGA